MASFEEQLKALESVVDRLEHGDLPLEESVRLFEEGVKLSEGCKKELEGAEGRVQVLMEGRNGKMRETDLKVESRNRFGVDAAGERE